MILQLHHATLQSLEKQASDVDQQQRKRRKANMSCWVAASFRDTQLYAIFETTFKTLDNLLRHTIPFDKRKSFIPIILFSTNLYLLSWARRQDATCHN